MTESSGGRFIISALTALKQGALTPYVKNVNSQPATVMDNLVCPICNSVCGSHNGLTLLTCSPIVFAEASYVNIDVKLHHHMLFSPQMYYSAH